MISPKLSKWLHLKLIDYEEDFFPDFLLSATRNNNILSFSESIDRQNNQLMLLKLTDIFVSYLPSLLFRCFCTLFHYVRRVSIFPFQANQCYSASTAVPVTKLHSRAIIVARGGYRGWLSHDYRGMREMMVKVKCKLTGIETAQYSYDRCLRFPMRPFLSLNYSCEKQKIKEQRKKTNVDYKSFFVFQSRYDTSLHFFVSYSFLLSRHTPFHTLKKTSP